MEECKGGLELHVLNDFVKEKVEYVNGTSILVMFCAINFCCIHV